MDFFSGLGALFEILTIPAHLREKSDWPSVSLILFFLLIFIGILTWVYYDEEVWPYETVPVAHIEDKDAHSYIGKVVEVQGVLRRKQKGVNAVFILDSDMEMHLLEGEDIIVRRGDKVSAICYVKGSKQQLIFFQSSFKFNECHTPKLVKTEKLTVSSKRLHKNLPKYVHRRVTLTGILEENGMKGGVEFKDFSTDIEIGSEISLECYVEEKKGIVFTSILVSECDTITVLAEYKKPIWKIW